MPQTASRLRRFLCIQKCATVTILFLRDVVLAVLRARERLLEEFPKHVVNSVFRPSGAQLENRRVRFVNSVHDVINAVTAPGLRR